MKRITAAVLLGIVLALPVIYWLRPLNRGAIALVVLVCVGVAQLVLKLIEASFGRKGKT